jgi:diguanylate cyclase (GGDEF)-like protein
MTIGVGLVAVGLGVFAWVAPWARWSTAACVWLPPAALALIATANTVGSPQPFDYAVFYVIVHVVTGIALPRHASVLLAPLTAIAYVVPLLVIAQDPGTAITSVLVVVPASALVGEGISWLIDALDSSEEVRKDLGLVLAQLEFTALHDEVTDLPNRASFYEHLDLALARARRTGDGLVVCSLDLDKFKLVNDTLGHVAGDALLRETAARLSSVVREGDVVARVGGDEFLALLPASDGDERLDDGETIVERIREALEPPVRLKEMDVYITASIGTAAFPTEASDAQSLLKVADAKMYRHKRLRSSIGLVEEARPAAEEELELSSRLRRSAKDPRWALRYQPIVELAMGRTIGAEALIRWQDPEHGLRGPSEFLSLVDELDLGSGMTRWVLDELAVAGRRWAEAGVLDDLTMLTVNLSPRELWHPALAGRIRRLASQLGRPELLVIEVTEAALLMDVARAQSVLGECRRSGVRVAIDDFGIGYSSLSRLRSLPIDIVKLDRSFIDGAERDEGARHLLRTIVRLISGLDMVGIAEGIETERQLEIVFEEGFSLAQGFLFGPPVHPDRFAIEAGEARPRIAV